LVCLPFERCLWQVGQSPPTWPERAVAIERGQPGGMTRFPLSRIGQCGLPLWFSAAARAIANAANAQSTPMLEWAPPKNN
jgi:hypothetical protein